MLTLDRRNCQLGLKASADGKEELKTLTFELADIPLDKRELNSLLGEPHAWDVLFNAGKHPVEPYLKSLKSLELKHVSEHAYACLWIGLKARKIEFKDAKVTKITLAPLDGGDTAMSCKITAAPVLDGSLAELFEQLGKTVECEIRADLADAQVDLPLNRFESPADDEGDDGDDDAVKRKPKRKGKMPPPKARKARHSNGART